MKLSDWIKEQKDALQQFSRFWKEKNKQDPDNFPLIMEEGEWIEQFLSFNSFE